jgi:hypothetical protein
MSDTVFANGMAVVHAGSSGKSMMAFPDVCLCPPSPPAGPVPTPLANTASAADLSGGATSVTVDGNPIAKKSSFIAKSTGDEAAQSTGGGVATHVVQGKTYFQSFSMDVLIEGENVPRHLDLTTHNHASPPPNTPPVPYLSKMNLPPPPATQQSKTTDQHWVTHVMEVVSNGKGEKLEIARSRKQFVNLDAQVQKDHAHPEYGRAVKVRAKVVSYGDTGKTSPANCPVHFWAKAGAKNATGLSGAHGAGFDSAGSGTLQKTVQSGDDGWTPDVVFHLSDRAGDEFTLYAAEHKEGEAGATPASAGPYTAWRCVFYQLTKMDPAPDGTRFDTPPGCVAKLRESLLPAFIELRPGSNASATVGYRENLLPADRGTVEASARAHAQDDTVPFKTNIIFVDHADTVKKDPHEDKGAIPPVPTAAGVPIPNHVTSEWFVYLPNPIVSAKYREVGARVWQDLPHPKLEVDPAAPAGTQPGMDKWVRIVGEIPNRDATKSYEYRFERRIVDVHAGGWGGTTGSLFICLGSNRRKNVAAPTAQEVQQVLAHELGHALGLVPTTASWRDTDSRDDKYSLRHCGHRNTDMTPRCVMWWQLGNEGNNRYDFCHLNDPDDCLHTLLKVDMGRAAMSWLK